MADKIKLITSDGKEVLIDKELACQCKIIKSMLDEAETFENIPLPSIDSSTISKVTEFSQAYAYSQQQPDNDNVQEVFQKFLKGFFKMDHSDLFALIIAAEYLEHRSLLDAACQKVADFLRAKGLEEIREEFGIENDLTKEEEEEIQKDYKEKFGDDIKYKSVNISELLGYTYKDSDDEK